jgi:hypothetical protein
MYPITSLLVARESLKNFKPSNTGEANPLTTEPVGVSLASSDKIIQPRFDPPGYWS